ncbi:MAG TPA: Rrf2 family transcriptional regulator [Bacteroidales bacterium]|nr:Rrf2 family transcriptional regulator [Bacteroidales bacterium]
MISNTCKYGIRALVYLASKTDGSGSINIKTISRDLNLPNPFLAKILQQLVRNKILYSSKGPHGGFSFAKDPCKISIYEIISIIDGNELFENCVIHNRTCKSADAEKLLCPIHAKFSNIRNEIIKLFRETTISHLVESAKQSNEIML